MIYSELQGIIGYDLTIEISKNDCLKSVDYARIPGKEDLWKESNCINKKIIYLPYLYAGKDQNITFEVCFDLNLLLNSKQSINREENILAFTGKLSF